MDCSLRVTAVHDRSSNLLFITIATINCFTVEQRLHLERARDLNLKFSTTFIAPPLEKHDAQKGKTCIFNNLLFD